MPRKDPASKALYDAEWRQKRPNYQKLWQWNKKLAVITKLGGKCVVCPVTDPRVLQINHKNGGGNREVHPISAKRFYTMILNGERSTEDLELRCANCNLLYEYERGARYDPDKKIHP